MIVRVVNISRKPEGTRVTFIFPPELGMMSIVRTVKMIRKMLVSMKPL